MYISLWTVPTHDTDDRLHLITGHFGQGRTGPGRTTQDLALSTKTGQGSDR